MTSDSPEIFRPLLLLLLEGEEEGVLVEDGGVDCLVHVGHLSLTPVIHRVFLAIKLSSLISFNYLHVIPHQSQIIFKKNFFSLKQ